MSISTEVTPPRTRTSTRTSALTLTLALILILALTPSFAASAQMTPEEREELRKLMMPDIEKPLAQPIPIGWRLEKEEAPLVEGSDVLETVWSARRPPRGEHDRIRVHRYRIPRARDTFPQAALLYLPGTFMNGTAALTDEDHNLWVFLARKGVDVFTLDYRTHSLPHDDPKSENAPEGLDLSPLRQWNTEAFLGDVKAAAAFMATDTGLRQYFVGGFSLGVSYAYAYALADPGNVAGIVALDGYFKDHAPSGEDRLTEALEKLDAEQSYAADLAGSRGWAARKRLMGAVVSDPAGPPLEEQLRSGDEKPATVGQQLSNLLYFAWGSGRLANAQDGHSDVKVLARLLLGYDRYFPDVQTLEGPALAEHEDAPWSPVDDGWKEFRKPVIYFGSTGMGPPFLLNGIHSAAHAGGLNVDLHVLEGWGHLDVIVGEKAREEVYEPIFDFLMKHRPAAP